MVTSFTARTRACILGALRLRGLVVLFGFGGDAVLVADVTATALLKDAAGDKFCIARLRGARTSRNIGGAARSVSASRQRAAFCVVN